MFTKYSSRPDMNKHMQTLNVSKADGRAESAPQLVSAPEAPAGARTEDIDQSDVASSKAQISSAAPS